MSYSGLVLALVLILFFSRKRLIASVLSRSATPELRYCQQVGIGRFVSELPLAALTLDEPPMIRSMYSVYSITYNRKELF